MPKPHLTIWCNGIEDEPELTLLREGTHSHNLILSNSSTKEPDERLCNADIAFGQPQPAAIRTCRKIKWIQLSSAGHSRYDSDALREALAGRGAILTNSSSVTAGPCAEHLAAMMLALSRHLPMLWLNQQTERAWKPSRPEEMTILEGQTALIVGYGAIGRRLAELLAPCRMNLIGFRRHPRGDEAIRIEPVDRLDHLLPSADHIINILPNTPQTRLFFNQDRLARLKPPARFYNIGRGMTVDQKALRQALLEERIQAAYLDVATPEPLPPDDPLWTTPRCYITPHMASLYKGIYADLVRHFLENLRRFEQGEELSDTIR